MQARSRYRWLICALLFLAVALLYMDRQILALLKPELDAEMKWSNQQFGWINGVFLGAYGVSMLISGRLVDRYGARLGFAVTMGAWAVSAALTSLARTVPEFLATRIAVGGSEGGCFPTSIKVAALWFPKSERALATSLFSSGAFAGAILAPLAIPWIAAAWGWRGAYLCAGGSGLAWLVAWLALYQPRRNVGAAEPNEDAEAAQPPAPWRLLLRHRQVWAFMLAKLLTDPVWWFLLIWLPDFFYRTRGLALKNSSIELVSIYSLITVLSISGCWLSGYLIKRGWSVTRARKSGMLLFAVCVLPILAAPRVGNVAAVLLLGLAGGAHGAWAPTLYTTVSDVFPKRVVASVIGLGGLVGSLSSMLFQPFAGGVLDFFRNRGGAQAGYHALFLICASAYILAFAVHHLLCPSLQPIGIGVARSVAGEPA